VIVDIGGGQGSLLIALLQANPHLRGILFDCPAAIRSAEPLIAAAGLAQRCELVPADFFDAIPGDGDTYLLSRVIHDWTTAEALRILTNVRRAMHDDALLLIIERALDQAPPTVEATLSDVHMMVMNGGHERTPNEYAALLDAAGFSMRRVIATRSLVHIVEAAPVG
jgi:hypothetical protein